MRRRAAPAGMPATAGITVTTITIGIIITTTGPRSAADLTLLFHLKA